jgi:signal transduction histidine kinase
MKPYSIKRRLIVSVLLVELVSTLCICGLALVYEHHARFRAFDVMLRGRADSLLGAVQDAEDAQDNVMLDGTEKSLPPRDIYEVWDQNGRILGHSPNWSALSRDRFAGQDRQHKHLIDGNKKYRIIRVNGVRVVDPGDKGGGIPRSVVILYGSPTGPVWKEIWEAVEFYAFTSLVLLVATGLLMFWLLSRGLAPLSELTAEAAKVSAASWNFVPSNRARNTTELAPLASALEAALKGLERSFFQQRRFVSDAAHELKTAVAVVKSSLQLLTMKPRTTVEYQAGLERCQLDCQRMEGIVADMLMLARIEGESLSPDRCQENFTTDLTRVVHGVIEQFASMAEIARLQFVVSAPDSLFLDLEQAQLELLCSNLALNAMQHSAPGGLITIAVERADLWAELRIIDTGTGIDQDLLPFIFERFYRSDPSRSRRTGGTGLGLAICKAIVEGAQGTIVIDSQLGRGTTVLIRLPLAHIHANDAEHR